MLNGALLNQAPLGGASSGLLSITAWHGKVSSAIWFQPTVFRPADLSWAADTEIVFPGGIERAVAASWELESDLQITLGSAFGLQAAWQLDSSGVFVPSRVINADLNLHGNLQFIPALYMLTATPAPIGRAFKMATYPQMILGAIVQQPADRLDYDILADVWLGTAGDVLLSVKKNSIPPGLDLMPLVVSPTRAKLWVSGPAGDYTAELTLSTEGGRIKQVEFRVVIEDVI